ncbi:hypothetical protein D3C71_1866220 [compost metagenome]
MTVPVTATYASIVGVQLLQHLRWLCHRCLSVPQTCFADAAIVAGNVTAHEGGQQCQLPHDALAKPDVMFAVMPGLPTAPDPGMDLERAILDDRFQFQIPQLYASERGIGDATLLIDKIRQRPIM